MYRVIKASSQNKLNSKEIRSLVGQSQYENLYKQGCMLMDDEIVNQYGDVKVNYAPGDCTGVKKSDGRIEITHQIYADFKSESSRDQSAYAEIKAECINSKIRNISLSYFNDEMEYE